jgi:long-chain acyl-CoA synthetase
LYRFDFVLTDVKYLIKALRLYKPTLLQGVPFFYNNLYEAFMAGIKSSYFKYTLFLAYKWCLRGVLTDSLNKKLQKKIFKGVYDFWGGRMRLLLTGAASSRKDVLDFFDIIGIPLYEVYGLVETGLITMNTLDSKKIGSVGKFLPHMDYKFAEDGELFVKSEYCWAEKYINCSIEENKKTFNEDGYISTGDIGYVDEDNFLYLKGRKKDIMVLMNGNNIHPVFLENELNGSPFIKQSAIYGNGKPFLVAVIVSENKDITKEMIKLEIKKANELINGKGEIKDFIIVNEPFSIENKLMNENMKINKNNIYRKYNIELEDLYE